MLSIHSVVQGQVVQFLNSSCFSSIYWEIGREDEGDIFTGGKEKKYRISKGCPNVLFGLSVDLISVCCIISHLMQYHSAILCISRCPEKRKIKVMAESSLGKQTAWPGVSCPVFHSDWVTVLLVALGLKASPKICLHCVLRTEADFHCDLVIRLLVSNKILYHHKRGWIISTFPPKPRILHRGFGPKYSIYQILQEGENHWESLGPFNEFTVCLRVR